MVGSTRPGPVLITGSPCRAGPSTTLPSNAVEALSDALRIEVARFGIDVVLIEPGPVKTPWNDVAAGSLSAATADEDAYREYKAAVGASFGRAQAGLFGRLGSTSEDIAKVITQAVTARR